jgi:hypothetical protein
MPYVLGQFFQRRAGFYPLRVRVVPLHRLLCLPVKDVQLMSCLKTCPLEPKVSGEAGFAIYALLLYTPDSVRRMKQ